MTLLGILLIPWVFSVHTQLPFWVKKVTYLLLSHIHCSDCWSSAQICFPLFNILGSDWWWCIVYTIHTLYIYYTLLYILSHVWLTLMYSIHYTYCTHYTHYTYTEHILSHVWLTLMCANFFSPPPPWRSSISWRSSRLPSYFLWHLHLDEVALPCHM